MANCMGTMIATFTNVHALYQHASRATVFARERGMTQPCVGMIDIGVSQEGTHDQFRSGHTRRIRSVR